MADVRFDRTEGLEYIVDTMLKKAEYYAEERFKSMSRPSVHTRLSTNCESHESVTTDIVYNDAVTETQITEDIAKVELMLANGLYSATYSEVTSFCRKCSKVEFSVEYFKIEGRRLHITIYLTGYKVRKFTVTG